MSSMLHEDPLADVDPVSMAKHLLHSPAELRNFVHHTSQSHSHEYEEKTVASVTPVDILRTSKEYAFYVDVPGLSKADIQVRQLIQAIHGIMLDYRTVISVLMETRKHPRTSTCDMSLRGAEAHTWSWAVHHDARDWHHEVTVEDEKTLVLRGGGKRKREEGEEEDCRYIRMERRASPRFVRKFNLPEDSDASSISAKCENGVLTVRVARIPPSSERKTVEIPIA